MKTDAGWKLCTRKPSAAPATIAASTAAEALPRSKAMTANDAAAIAHTPAARPSTPSEKLTTLITATRPSTVSGPPRLPRSTWWTTGSVKVLTVTPAFTGTTTAPTGPASLGAGGRSTTSSTAPTTVMIAAPTRIARYVEPTGMKARAATSTPAKIATPPSSGVSRRDRPRSRGSSTAPNRRASRPTGGVSTAVTAAATSAPNSASTSWGTIRPQRIAGAPPGPPSARAKRTAAGRSGDRPSTAAACGADGPRGAATAPPAAALDSPPMPPGSAACGYAQTLPLARRLGIDHHAVGAHGGGSRANKLARLAERSAALWRWARPRRFDLAVAHGSNDLAVVARMLRIPAVDMFDYQWATLQHTVGCRPARRVITPDAIPPERLRRYGVTAAKLAQFPGLKEEYYLADFAPDRGVLDALGVDQGRVLVAVRPPPDVSLYHRKANRLFPQVLDHIGRNPDVHAVVLPRTEQQRRFLRWLNLPSLIVPDEAVDGQSLVALVDLVVSAGGTMNREAVALGTPVYTTYGGRLGAVAEAPIREGR